MQDDGNDPSYVGLQSTANPSQLILLGTQPRIRTGKIYCLKVARMPIPSVAHLFGSPTWIRTKSKTVRGFCVAVTPSGYRLADRVGVEPTFTGLEAVYIPDQRSIIWQKIKESNP